MKNKLDIIVEKFSIQLKSKEILADFINIHKDRLLQKHNLVKGGKSSFEGAGKLSVQLPSKVIDELKNYILSAMDNKYRVLDMWVNVHPPKAYVTSHTHYTQKYPNLLSGVYYLKKPKNSGNIVFETGVVNVEEGDLIIFHQPAKGGKHWTERNNSDQDRIVVSFNLTPNENTTIQKISLFSSLLQIVSLNNRKLNTQLIKYASSLKKKTKKIYVSNRGGFQSQPLSIEDNPLLQKFIGTTKTAIENYISSYQLADSYEARIAGLWFNINSKHHYNITHVHPDCQFTGSYYIQVPKNCGKLILEHPCTPHQMDIFYGNNFTNYNEYTSNVYRHDPRVGDLILFPAWVPHHVEYNESSRDRISISFNIKIKTVKK